MSTTQGVSNHCLKIRKSRSLAQNCEQNHEQNHVVLVLKIENIRWYEMF